MLEERENNERLQRTFWKNSRDFINRLQRLNRGYLSNQKEGRGGEESMKFGLKRKAEERKHLFMGYF